MIGITARTGTKTTLREIARRRWWLLVSAAAVWRTEDFTYWVAENGAFAYHLRGVPFDEQQYARFLRWICKQPNLPQWIALPDIVCGGSASLDLSVRWMRIIRRIPKLASVRLMLVVQDGMDTCAAMLTRIRKMVRPGLGIFLGGSTEWKEARANFWGAFCRWFCADCYHVGRVNSERRIDISGDAGAESFDGNSPVMFPKTLPALDSARRNVILKRSQLNWLEAA